MIGTDDGSAERELPGLGRDHSVRLRATPRRRRPIASAAVVLTLGQLSACSSDEDAADSASPATPSEAAPAGGDGQGAAAELDALVDRARKNASCYVPEVPGLILLVAQGDQTRQMAVGMAQLEPTRPMGVDDRFGIGSVTKMMVAAVILQLVEEGSVGLDDTVEQWVPGMLAFGDAVTVEDLLDHRSGILNVVETTDYEGSEDLTDELLTELLDHAPTDPPDTVSRYTNPGYWLLGKIIERATGRPLATELRDRVFSAAEMTDAVLSLDLDDEPRLVRGYDVNDQDITLGDYSGVWAAGGIVATAADVDALCRQ